VKKPLSPVPPRRVLIDDTFWAPRLETNRSATIPLVYQRLVETGRLEALRLSWKPGDANPPEPHWESDIAKWVEAASYSLAGHPDPELLRRVDEVIELFRSAQQPDGYVNAHFTVVAPGQRWTNLRDKHELYSAGHLIEAAVAHFQATGQRSLLDVATRFVDHIAATFGTGPEQKRGYPGHSEIELALLRLYRVTREPRHLALAQYFIDERGRTPNWFDVEAQARGEQVEASAAETHLYNQSHAPVREQTRAVGQAVRALHLYAAMTDLAQENSDDNLMAASLRLWDSVYLRQTYLTGGIGSSRANAGFTFDYDLPNDGAYAETCATVASVFWNHRLLHWNCEARFGDELERALYNGVLAGVSPDGGRFFCTNPLAIHPNRVSPNDSLLQVERTDWNACSCCPPNLARLLASFGQYIYSEADAELAVHLFVRSRAELNVGGGTVVLRQETDYPWEGHVRLTIEKVERPSSFILRVRLPGWCRSPDVTINGEPSCHPVRNGYAAIHRQWNVGDVVEVLLPMPVERVRSHPAIRENQGCVALRRGPIVYCVESFENGPLDHLVLPRNAAVEARFEPALFGGSKIIYGNAVAPTEETWRGSLYRTDQEPFRESPLRAIPYFCWANRGPGEMRVWIRETEVAP
jgi:DUF1680 family protein